MCGIAGIYGHDGNLKARKKLIKQMTETLKRRGPDDVGYLIDDYVLFGHRRLAIRDIKKGKQPMTYKEYTIIYNGELYNMDEVRNLLIAKGYRFKTHSDTEVLLKGYVEFKEKILDMIEGIYAFAIYDGNSVFLARDHFGVKPLFYSKIENTFIFASEIKSILASKLVKPVINIRSLQELLALGPSKTPGSGIFKDINELKPAHYLIYKNGKIQINRYWNVEEQECDDTFEETKEKVCELIRSSVKKQMVSDIPIATLLSGGLDSSIITAIVSNEFRKEKKRLTTYSIDYEDNDKYFKSNRFQVSEDKRFIKIMSNKFKTNHCYKVITQKQLASTLKESLFARDYPGMADIDSSLYWFSKKISRKHRVVLSGEGADEIFGGYPWFCNPVVRDREYFPWINNLAERNNLLKKELQEKLNLKDFVKERYEETIKEMPSVSKEKKIKELFYINMIWFMPTLLERKDRMTMRTSVEARVPYVDKKLVQYLWNIPWQYKFYQSKEKGLLREAFKDLLPDEIAIRKKNPYPKTHNPKYTKMVCKLLSRRLKNKKSVLYQIFDADKIKELISTSGSCFRTPWFGQLMTGPQLIAYLYQFDIWAEKYKIILEIN